LELYDIGAPAARASSAAAVPAAVRAAVPTCSVVQAVLNYAGGVRHERDARSYPAEPVRCIIPGRGTRGQFRDYLKSEFAKFSRLIKKAGIKAELAR